MAFLQQYASFEEKQDFFEWGNLKINTKDEFDKYWEKLLNYDRLGVYKFRGCSEAKYKLFTSAQRYWIEKELAQQNIYYHEFVKGLIKNSKTWNNETIFKFFNINGISTNNTLAYLSYMQHYGVPTPLIDFTDNPFIGLFFALENPRHTVSDKDIDNYASLYILDASNPYLSATRKKFENKLTLNTDGEIDYEQVILFPLLLVTPDNEAYRIINNINISNQQGLFVFNNSPLDPMELAYKVEIDAIKNSIGPEEFELQGFKPQFASCLNIHKNLRDYVLSKLKEKGITLDYIYPDNSKLTQSAIKKTLEEIR